MITLRSKKTDEVIGQYTCDRQTLLEYAYANAECLLHIALADSDKHIRKLGGESKILELINGYVDLAERLEFGMPLSYKDEIKEDEQ